MNRLIIVLIMLFTPFAYADNEIDFFSFTGENDAFYRDDGLYSNGLLGSWGYDDVEGMDEQTLPDWLAYLVQKSYLYTQQDKHYAISYTVAHLIQTAIEIKVQELVEEDAPYVGMFAWETELTTYDEANIDRLSLLLGAVGPAAGGEYMQKVVHGVIGASEPQGWDNQIGNEFIINLQGERSWRVYEKMLESSEFDIVTGIRGEIGNFRSDVGVGVDMRWGRGLQNNFSSASAFPAQKLNTAHHSSNGWYFFANSSAFYVVNDIFIDGNSFQESHCVDLIHLQYGASVGVMVNIDNWNIVYTILQLSDQYHGQNERSRFGSLTFTYYF